MQTILSGCVDELLLGNRAISQSGGWRHLKAVKCQRGEQALEARRRLDTRAERIEGARDRISRRVFRSVPAHHLDGPLKPRYLFGTAVAVASVGGGLLSLIICEPALDEVGDFLERQVRKSEGHEFTPTRGIH
jgi:hypothetical protein